MIDEMINKIILGDCQDIMPLIPEKSVDLIIADPPYFEVKGDFDFKWDSFDDYLKDVEKWATGCKRILADNGSLLWYGHAKKIAYSQIILDKYFNLENSLVWDVFDRQTKKGVENFRSFAPVTERILFYSNEIIRTGLEEIKLDVNNFKSLRNYFEGLQKYIGLGLKKINDILGHRRAEHGFYWSSTQWDLPILEIYNQLIDIFKINNWSGFREYEELRQEYEELRQEYEELRQEYEELRRPFDNHLKLTDILKFSQEGHKTGKIDHDTVKPEALTRAFINTCSRPGGLVFIPFSGSGTECCMSHIEGRNFIACETDKKHHRDSVKRLEELRDQGRLF